MSTDRASTPRDGRTGPGRSTTALTAALLASAVAVTACSDDSPLSPGGSGGSSDETASTSELTFLTQSPDAPRLLLQDDDGDGFRDTTFVATRGQDTEVEVFYEDPDNSGQRGDRFLEFELEEESLLRYPDDHPMNGAEFGPGDTITITFELRGDTLAADFQPSGLEFNPDEPAELEMRWTNADEDTDDDGEDELDEQEDQLDLWKQEAPGEDWLRSGDVKDLERDRLRAFVESFTRWAVAI